MRAIKKGGECKKLRDWRKSNSKAPQNIHYNNLAGEVRQAVLATLTTEQGGLCAYTMKQLVFKEGVPLAHIEHILPRSKHAEKSLEWTNLIACFPQPGVACEYGAVCKGDYDPASQPFVNPTNRGASTRFICRGTGELIGVDCEAQTSISERVLNLNHPELKNDRRAKIEGALLNRPSAKQAKARAEQLRLPDKRGFFEPYCEAVAQVLEAYARRLENKARRVAFDTRR